MEGRRKVTKNLLFCSKSVYAFTTKWGEGRSSLIWEVYLYGGNASSVTWSYKTDRHESRLLLSDAIISKSDPLTGFRVTSFRGHWMEFSFFNFTLSHMLSVFRRYFYDLVPGRTHRRFGRRFDVYHLEY